MIDRVTASSSPVEVLKARTKTVDDISHDEPRHRFLWLIELDYQSRLHHGGNLRWFSLSRELLLRGHHVYFAINRHPLSELPGRRAYLAELQHDGVITGFVELNYSPPLRRGWFASLLTHPRLIDLWLRKPRGAVLRELQSAIAEHHIELCLVSDRTLLFAIPALERRLPVFVDWVDSFVLHSLRQIALLVRRRRPRALLRAVRNLVAECAQERYYTRHSSLSLVVSPVDRRCLDIVSRVPFRSRVLHNGIDLPASAPKVPKDSSRLIFTGNMNFPPNYDAAIWFIDHVLPMIRMRHPAVTFVVAGRNPTAALKVRASERVVLLGAVDDLRGEIAKSALYVAPLISGGGFKNKILEAIASGTYVVGTPVAVEFLPSTFRNRLRVGDTAQELAENIIAFLDDPDRFNAIIPELQTMLARDFQWASRGAELIELASEVLAKRRTRARG